jgi:hypothetical protein
MRRELIAFAAVVAAATMIPDTASAHRSGGCGLMITPEVRTQWMSVDTPTSSEADTTFKRVSQTILSYSGIACLTIRFSAEATVPAGASIEVRAVVDRRIVGKKRIAEPGAITLVKAGDTEQTVATSFEWGVPGPLELLGHSVEIEWRVVGVGTAQIGRRVLSITYTESVGNPGS